MIAKLEMKRKQRITAAFIEELALFIVADMTNHMEPLGASSKKRMKRIWTHHQFLVGCTAVGVFYDLKGAIAHQGKENAERRHELNHFEESSNIGEVHIFRDVVGVEVSSGAEVGVPHSQGKVQVVQKVAKYLNDRPSIHEEVLVRARTSFGTDHGLRGGMFSSQRRCARSRLMGGHELGMVRRCTEKNACGENNMHCGSLALLSVRVFTITIV